MADTLNRVEKLEAAVRELKEWLETTFKDGSSGTSYEYGYRQAAGFVRLVLKDINDNACSNP